MIAIVRIIGSGAGNPTPHDGRYLVAWNPHTEAGTLECTSTADRNKAGRFETIDIFRQWKTVSQVQPRRPWDGEPNRPLTGLSISVERP